MQAAAGPQGCRRAQAVPRVGRRAWLGGVVTWARLTGPPGPARTTLRLDRWWGSFPSDPLKNATLGKFGRRIPARKDTLGGGGGARRSQGSLYTVPGATRFDRFLTGSLHERRQGALQGDL